jgi:L-asparaginase/Glu-tRNA(Gln) amidotransferase subunit D
MLARTSPLSPYCVFNCSNITATLRLFPGIAAATVRAFLMPPIRGVILETFGAGNAPQRTDLMASLKEACDQGVVVVAISQCAKGSVNSEYETGRALLQAGVVPGGDMTPEVRQQLILLFVGDKLHFHFLSVHSQNSDIYCPSGSSPQKMCGI